MREFCSLLAAGAELSLPGFMCMLSSYRGGVKKLLPPEKEIQVASAHTVSLAVFGCFRYAHCFR